MPKFQHNGTTIQLTDRGEFVAQVNGKRAMKPSLKAMKDFLDNEAKKAFEPVSMLARCDRYGYDSKEIKGTKLKRITVTSLVKSDGRFRRNEPAFCDEVGQLYARCYQDCPEAIDAAKAIVAHDAETRRIREKREDEMEKLKVVLHKFSIEPETFKAK